MAPKWFAAQTVKEVACEALQLHGGYGYIGDLSRPSAICVTASSSISTRGQAKSSVP